MILSRKLAAALLLVPVLFIGAFMVSVLGAYGSFSDIPHHDVVMWTFWAVVGLLIVLVYAVILVFVVTLQDESVEIEEDGSYLEISETVEIPVEEPIERDLIFDEGTEEEAPDIDQLEPQEHKDRKASEIQPPAIWKEEDFE